MVLDPRQRRGQFDLEEPEELSRWGILSARWVRALVVLVIVGGIAGYYLSDSLAPVPPPVRREAKAPIPPPPVETAPVPSVELPRITPTPRPVTKAPSRSHPGVPVLPVPETPPIGAPGPGAFWIQLGAFTNPANAARLAAGLASQRYPVERLAVERSGGGGGQAPLHVVRVGGFPDRQRAEAVQKELSGKGFSGFIVKAHTP